MRTTGLPRSCVPEAATDGREWPHPHQPRCAPVFYLLGSSGLPWATPTSVFSASPLVSGRVLSVSLFSDHFSLSLSAHMGLPRSGPTHLLSHSGPWGRAEALLSPPLGADWTRLRSRPAPSRDLEVSALPPGRFRVCKWTRAVHGEEEQAWGCLPLKTLFPPTPWQSLSPGELSVSLHTFQGSSREGAPRSPRHGGRAADKMETPPDRSPQPCCGGWLERCPAGFTTPCLPGLPREAAHLGSTTASWLPLVPGT